jgi:ComF family protein
MLKYLLNLFYPEVCCGCENLLIDNENEICIRCRHHIPLTNHLEIIENEAFKKFNGRLPIEHASSMMYYHKKGIVQQLIHQLKYKNKTKIGSILGQWHAEEIANHAVLKSVDYIIPVPLHKKRLKERGYNQVYSFCKSISDTIQIPIEEKVLYRKEYTKTQSKKGLVERNSISETTFDVHFTQLHHDKHFLIIDDVLTTGATLVACGNALLKIPNAKISVLTMAFSHS